MINCVRNPTIIGGYYKVEPIYSFGDYRPNQLKVSMRTWSWTRPNITRYAEFYIHNDPADWHDGHARKAAKKWQETFSFCKS